MSDRSIARNGKAAWVYCLEAQAFFREIRTNYRPQARSNPVPALVSGRHAIPVAPTMAAPLHRIRHNRGTITRTLGDGLGTVQLEPPRKAKRRDSTLPMRVAYSPRLGAVLIPDQRHATRLGYRVPKSPSWRKEIAGWSADYRIERGDPCLFDDCKGIQGKLLRGWERAPSW